MSYNDNAQNFIKDLTLENCPQRWIELAKYYQNDLGSLNKEERQLYTYIIQNFLSEGSETVSLTGSDATSTDTGSSASAASHTGSTDLSGGYDWGETPQEFTLDGTTVTLDTATSDVATTVTEINDALSTAGVSGVEAFADGDNVGIRTTATGSAESFTLTEGDGALSTLGMTAGTYTGADEVVGWAEFQPNFGNVGVAESSFTVEVNGSVVDHTVQGYGPLRIRLNSVPASSDTVVFMANNPYTTRERLLERFEPLQPYLYHEGE